LANLEEGSPWHFDNEEICGKTKRCTSSLWNGSDGDRSQAGYLVGDAADQPRIGTEQNTSNALSACNTRGDRACPMAGQTCYLRPSMKRLSLAIQRLDGALDEGIGSILPVSQGLRRIRRLQRLSGYSDAVCPQFLLGQGSDDCLTSKD
jgi:hypothetical protein